MSFDDDLVFCIPLKPKCTSTDWEQVCEMLQNTVLSIQNSTDKRFFIVIAGHDKPELPRADWTTIEFVAAPFSPPNKEGKGKGWDKLKKRRLAAAWVKERCKKRCRLAYVDADDLVSNALVDHALKAPEDTSIVIDSGYRIDDRNGDMELIPKRFSRHCGSCFLPIFQKSELPDSWDDESTVFSQFDSHSKFYSTCESLGRKVDLMRKADIVYLMNHADSLEYAKKGMKEDVVEANLSSKERDDILLNRFSCKLSKNKLRSSI